MMLETLPALALFALVTSVTPGPNNLMLMASGANFGFRRTVPHMLGVGLGFVLMTFLVGIGLAGLFQTYPVAVTALDRQDHRAGFARGALVLVLTFVLALRLGTGNHQLAAHERLVVKNFRCSSHVDSPSDTSR